jgi:hypothetical protein
MCSAISSENNFRKNFAKISAIIVNFHKKNFRENGKKICSKIFLRMRKTKIFVVRRE